MTARAVEAVGVAPSWLTLGIDPMVWFRFADSRLASQGTWSLRLGRHRSDNQVVALLQVPFDNGADFCVRMICDSKRNLHRLHRLIGMKLPNHGSLCFRCSRQILGTHAS